MTKVIIVSYHGLCPLFGEYYFQEQSGHDFIVNKFTVLIAIVLYILKIFIFILYMWHWLK